MSIRSYRDLEIWQKGKELVKFVYILVKSFPREEIYSLTQQIKRASISVIANIAEGCARNNRKEFIQFLGISLGSLAELDTELEISKDLGFIEQDNSHYKTIMSLIQEIRAQTLTLKTKLMY